MNTNNISEGNIEFEIIYKPKKNNQKKLKYLVIVL